ncbi:MAG: hypothetical protein ABSG50_13525 [Opitutaceae bacterium]
MNTPHAPPGPPSSPAPPFLPMAGVLLAAALATYANSFTGPGR